ncbi:MAG: ABC transporter ATP-binding protein [Rhodobacteraceae bacterium]|nr:ABC transporter ATP-binding protein [Paracoccaceae bacterium]MCZ8085552.1 ABC transporter ATP-binding protein [Paracoccaceae bacterium]
MTSAFGQNVLDGKVARVFLDNFPSQKKTYAIAIVAMIAVAAATSATALLMQLIFDSLSGAEGAWPAAAVAALVVSAFTLKGLASYVQIVAMAKAGNRIVANLQRKIYSKLLRQDARYFETTESSDILMRVTQSAAAARMIIEVIVSGFVRDLLTLLGLICVMVYQHALLSAVFLVIGPLAIFGVRQVLVRVREIMSAELQSLAEIFKALQETSVGMRVIKAFSLEQHMEARMSKAVRDVERRSNALIRLEGVTAPMMDTLAGIAIATIVLVASAQFFGAYQATPGQLMSFVTALLMAYEPAKRLSRMRVQIEAGKVGVDMMYGILDRTDTMVDPQDAVELPDGPGRVSLRNVSFSYDGTRKVLDTLSIEFEPNKVTALVGPSGAGKSTVMSLLLRLFDPDEGAVEIDGIDIRHVKLKSLRAATAYVGQDVFLFAGTVRDNLRVGRPNASDDEIIKAARLAHAHEFISTLPAGYDTPVGENGVFFSGGQKQRLSLARAILKEAKIILLDEATSALDTESEQHIQFAVRELSPGRTIVMIAHRPEMVASADVRVNLQETTSIAIGAK